ncbi:helix-turn-helix domain-containing protein [Pedobacter kyonggii]|uniref:Transposase n=1 Tax=Pedobacter kyonggii TaxID=1926871 RepID=A0A4Q9HEG2_9SPHI|nr:helix-turn-helix domain-containing protein [Pedobacter kyonggii]TBO42993.1 transposase [Pedobacter kyonggii]
MRRKYTAEFRLKLVKEYLAGQSKKGLAELHGVPRTLLRRWISYYESFGNLGLVSKKTNNYPIELKVLAIECYRYKTLSLKECCIRFNIANDGTLLGWLRKYEQFGIGGLDAKPKGRKPMQEDKKPLSKKEKPLTRLEELERENLYLRAENEVLKKLEALTLKKQAQKRKR